MLNRVYHWLSGYVEFRVRGDGPRLFTMAAKRGLGLWGFGRDGDMAVARMKPREYKKLRALCRRCGAAGRLTKKRGLPFQAMRLRRRKGLVIGAVLGALLYWQLSGYIWGVTVSGTEKTLPRQVLSAARDSGVYVGADREAMRERAPENSIQAMIPELSWVSVNTDGCFAQVAVKEAAPRPEREQVGEASNVVAARAGKVVGLEAREGRPEVRLGEAVSAGQVLISGAYQEEPDPWNPQAPEPYHRVGAARGSVIAETYREFTVQVGAVKSRPVEAGRRSALWLRAFGLELPLGLWDRYEGEAREWSEVWQARALGVELPLGIERRVTVYLEEEKRGLTEEEQRASALMKLREAQRAQLPEGSSIVKEELEFAFTDGLCILRARCRCREEIGVVQQILVE